MPPDSPRLIRNNFDLLRLIFASIVLVVHAYELSGFPELKVFAGLLSSDVAVKSFFVVSGFLIFMSCERSSSLAGYAAKRARRIYPAYVAVVSLCAIGLVLASAKPITEYFSLAWVTYVVANLAFLNFVQPSLPGVFEANRLPFVNGALWTLKIEVMFYMSVPIFVWAFRRTGRLPLLLVGYCLSVAYAAWFARAAARTGSGLYLELGRQLPGQLSYFLAGGFFYYYLPVLERYTGWFLAGAVAALAANRLWPLPVLEPFALATVVVGCGVFAYAGNAGKYGDFSYGVYILHFPVIQLLLQAGWFAGNPYGLLVTTILITAAAAIAMWHLVEKRWLLRSSHYVAATVRSPEATPGLVPVPSTSPRS